MFGGYDLDLLEIRLETLSEVVDKFIICEAPITHTLIPKSLVFLDNQSRFDKFKDKIVYVIAKCEHENPFINDWNYRNILFDKVPKHTKSTILTGDLDEIPNPEILKYLTKNLKKPISLEVNYHFYCCDLFGRKDTSNILLENDWITEDFYKYRDARNSAFFGKIKNSGWHFSSCGKIENIINKWKAFAHSQDILEKYKNPEYIKKQIKRKAGSWDENSPDNELKLVEHKYPLLPKYLLENKKRFEYLFYNYYK